MFSTKAGNPLALIVTGDKKGELISISDDGNLGKDFMLRDGTMMPILNTNGERSVEYIAGPSGSGKSTIVADMVRRYLKANPTKKVFLFSRSPKEDDPIFKGIPFNQILLTEKLLDNKVDVTKISPGTLLVFDDVGTVADDRVRMAVEKIMMDVMEVGRKYKVSVIMTSHHVIPHDKKFARTVMAELKYLTIFPKSGSTYHIEDVLKRYLGIDTKNVKRILALDSRWVRIHAGYPRYVLYDKGAYLI